RRALMRFSMRAKHLFRLAVLPIGQPKIRPSLYNLWAAPNYQLFSKSSYCYDYFLVGRLWLAAPFIEHHGEISFDLFLVDRDFLLPYLLIDLDVLLPYLSQHQRNNGGKNRDSPSNDGFAEIGANAVQLVD